MRDLMSLPASALRAAEDAKRMAAVKRSHAAMPGTGPVGETCGSCNIAYDVPRTNSIRCGKAPGLGRGIVRFIGRDDPACSKWEARDATLGRGEVKYHG